MQRLVQPARSAACTLKRPPLEFFGSSYDGVTPSRKMCKLPYEEVCATRMSRTGQNCSHDVTTSSLCRLTQRDLFKAVFFVLVPTTSYSSPHKMRGGKEWLRRLPSTCIPALHIFRQEEMVSFYKIERQA